MTTVLRIIFLAGVLSASVLSSAAFSQPLNCDGVLYTAERLPPRTDRALTAIRSFVDFVNAHKFQTDLLPFVDPEKIKNLEYVKRGGHRNYGTYEGRLGDREVFIKALAFYEERGVGEAFWFQFLNSHGLGAKFIAITRIGNDWAIVTERLEGLNVKARKSLTEAQIKEINNQINRLFDLGIYPKDLQFVMTPKGPVLIDPEFFTTYGEKNEANRSYFLKQYNTVLQVLGSEMD